MGIVQKYLILSALLSAMTFSGCDSNSDMCKEDSDCYSLCVTYSQTNMIYACSEGQCLCADETQLACEADEVVEAGEKPHCEKLCDALKPGTKGVCTSGACACTESTGEDNTPEEEKKQCQKDEECYALCYTLGQTSLYACSANQCLCAGEDKVACRAEEEGSDGELSHCQLLCNTLKPGMKGACTDSRCTCQKE